MKPFGVRLALGAVTIMLGALAAAQAQKERGANSDSSWTVADSEALRTPPTPIMAIGNEGWNGMPSDDSNSDASKRFPDKPKSAIALAQYIESKFELPQQPMDSAPSIGLPSFGELASAPKPNNAPDSEPGGLPGIGGFGLPSMGGEDEPQQGSSTNNRSARPESLRIPSPAKAPATDSLVADNTNGAIPTLDMSFPGQATGATEAANPPNPNEQQGFPTLQLPASITNGGPSGIVPAMSLGNFGSNANSLRSSVDESASNQNPTPEPQYAPPNGFGVPLREQQVAPEPALPKDVPNSAFALNSNKARDNTVPSARLAPFNAGDANPPQDFPRTMGVPPQSSSTAVDPQGMLNSPGDRRLEGVQSPSIVIQKRAPNEVKVGKPASFVIHVQNVGAFEALDVRVHDRVPAGMQLVDASPAPILQGDVLLWQLGAMPSGEERTITMQLLPLQEGELGSVARVTFEAAASVRTISTRPQLQIVQRAPKAEVLIGQQLEIEIEASNIGTGDAEGVVLQEDVPDGFEHPRGRELDNALGVLRAGETRRQVLRVRAVAPGRIQNVVRLVSADGLTAEHAIDVDVVAPQLKLDLAGPSRRFLERQATYQLELANIGTTSATNVEIIAYLDRGFTFISTANEGQYDPTKHAVFWSLHEIPKGSRGQVPLTLLPVEEGERTIRLEARGDLGVSVKSERNVTVDALAELTFQITDAADPIELGSETTYEIRVTNRGSRSDGNIQVQLQLPRGLELVSTDGDAGTDDRGLVQFAPYARLDSGQEFVQRIRVRGVNPGTHLTKAVVVSDGSKIPVTKEESTMVYADQ